VDRSGQEGGEEGGEERRKEGREEEINPIRGLHG
jgi:hypothetical protein